MKKKILIVCPHLNLKGGVANYYRTIKNNYSSDKFELSYFYLSPLGGSKGMISTISSLLWQYLSFFKSLSGKDEVLLNPSLQKNALPRDFIFYLISKLFGKDVTILIHGWDLNYQNKISNSTLLKKTYRSMFSNSRVFALASEFCDYINHLCRKEVAQRTVTFADPELFVGFDLEKEFNTLEFLYMSRITKDKGCLEAIDIFCEILKRRPDASLSICGTGDYLEQCKEHANRKNIGDKVRFLGFVDASEKVGILASTNITLFPTKHGEGLPITLVESMHAGHVIISSNSGGIKDVFDGTDNLILELNKSEQWSRETSNYVFALTENKLIEISKDNVRRAKENHGINRVFEQILGA